MRAWLATSMLVFVLACEVVPGSPRVEADDAGIPSDFSSAASAPQGFRILPQKDEYDLWGEADQKPASRSEASGLTTAGGAHGGDPNPSPEDLQAILYRKDFDLASALGAIRESFPTCHVPRMTPRLFRRPKGGGHDERWIDPSKVLGFLFDPRQCETDEAMPQTELCKVTRRWIDPTGNKSVLKITLTPRTEPFRDLFLGIAESFNRVALEANLVGDRQKMVEILDEADPYRVDCDRNTFDFVHPIAIRKGGAKVLFDGHAVTIRYPKTGVILDSDIFIDPKSLVDADLDSERFLAVLRRDFAHEIAHALGMVDNLSERTESLMNYYALDDPRSTRAELTPYDLAVLRFIYQGVDDPDLLRDPATGRLWDLKRAHGV